MQKGLVSSERFLEGGGLMGQLIREKDWAQTPLGNPATWPQSLKICVRIVLTSSQPMFVWWGPQLINIYNDAYLSIIGGKHPQSLGQPAAQVWAEIWEQVGERAAIVMGENRGTYDESLLLLMERNGYTEETYYTFSYSPVPGDDGTTQGIICANTDDTQAVIGARQLQTLKELSKSVLNVISNQDIYERALESLQSNPQDFPFVVLYEISKDGKQMRLTKRFPENLPESMALPIVDLETNGFGLSEVKRCIDSGTMQEVNGIRARFGHMPSGFWNDSPDKALLIPIKQTNREYPFALMSIGLNPYRLLDDKYLDFFSLVGDQIATALTNSYAFKQERKRAESLAEIDKAKTIFFNNISHEFRTPLTLMLGPLEELLRPGHQFESGVHENIEITHRNAMRLLKLVNSLLDFSRIESGRIDARFRAVDLAEITANYASAFRSIVENAGMQFNVSGTIGSPVYVDTALWEKIVLNLLSNSFKHTFSGSIFIQLDEQDNHAVVRFSDTGVGIPEVEKDKVFDRFHRVKNAESRSYEGTGIGLSLVKELVRLHHGEISLESQQGHGTTFTIKIPLGSAHLNPSDISNGAELRNEIITNSFIEEARLMTRDKPDTGTQRSKNIKVLVVDDNLDMQEYISKLFEPHYQVLLASNGQQALDILNQTHPDVVVSDVMMPIMDGIELLHRIKSNPETRLIPVMLLSARAGEEAKIEGYEWGADDYLVKPFSAKELLARVQAQLRLSQKRTHLDLKMQRLFQQAPLAICILRGREFVVELANKYILNLWGRTEEEMLGKKLEEALPEAKAQGFIALLTSVFESGKTLITKEHPFETSHDGNYRKIFVKFVYEPLFEQDGTLSGIVVMADDITDLVMNRKAIEVSETRYKLALEAAQLGNYELDVADAKFIYSDRLAQLFGLSGTDPFDHTDFTARIHPEDRNVREKAHQESYLTGVLKYEARVVWSDKSEHWLRFNGRVTFDDDNKPFKIYGTAIDISEHKAQALLLEQKVEERTRVLKKRNRELRESEERYQRMTEEVQDYVIIMLDKGGTILNWNKGAEKIKGYREDEIIGKNFKIFYSQEDLENQMPEKLIAEAIESGRAITEGYRLRKDGTIFWGSTSMTALHDNSGSVIGFSKVTRDLSERKFAEDKMLKYNSELEFQNRELEQFAYVASHDLQEPLRKIQMFSGLLEDNFDNPEAARRYFPKINATAGRMSELIKAVLNYSRLSRNDQQFERVNLDQALQNVLVDFELLIEEKNATIHYDSLPEIEAIPLQVNQLFFNLVGNALKFSDERPVLKISGRVIPLSAIPFETNLPDRNYLEMVFSDNGIGFEEKYVDKIFTIFQRLNDRVSYSGTGIGLALCKKIIENHKGFITARSEHGHGASFYLYLPA